LVGIAATDDSRGSIETKELRYSYAD
jgi:hypothetical protein